MTKPSADPNRAQLLELSREIEDHVATLRDFALIPGNAWLARGELHQLSGLLADLENLLDSIKQDDIENGF